MQNKLLPEIELLCLICCNPILLYLQYDGRIMPCCNEVNDHERVWYYGTCERCKLIHEINLRRHYKQGTLIGWTLAKCVNV